ncbi:MAG: hypothetical protein ABSF18_04025 [Gammaproteobacteria bacterium]|jgi:chaperonin cofactor prefoldin
MSYTIKSLQKSLTLLQDEFQDLGHTQSKNHIQDMYNQFQTLAERVSRQHAKKQQIELD